MKELTPIQIWIALAAFLIGCAIPIVYSKLILKIKRARELTKEASNALVLFSFLFSFGLGACGLIYLSTLGLGLAPTIVLSFMIGLGLVRWVRKEL